MSSELIESLKQACAEESSHYENLIPGYLSHGDKGMVNLGALTPRIAAKYGKPLQKTRSELHRLHKAGLVINNDNRRQGGTIRWWPVGYCEEFAKTIKKPGFPG